MANNKYTQNPDSRALHTNLRVCIPGNLLSRGESGVLGKSESIVLEYPLESSPIGSGINVCASVSSGTGEILEVRLSASACPVEIDNISAYGQSNCDFMGVPHDGHPRDYAEVMGEVNSGVANDLPF